MTVDVAKLPGQPSPPATSKLARAWEGDRPGNGLTHWKSENPQGHSEIRCAVRWDRAHGRVERYGEARWSANPTGNSTAPLGWLLGLWGRRNCSTGAFPRRLAGTESPRLPGCGGRPDPVGLGPGGCGQRHDHDFDPKPGCAIGPLHFNSPWSAIYRPSAEMGPVH